jgi:chromosome segregation ATPase
MTSNAGAKSTLDIRQAHETIQAQIKKIDSLTSSQHELVADFSEIRELVGLGMGDANDRSQLKRVIKQLKQRNETLYDENRQLGDVIESLKLGRFNETEGAKMIMDEAHQQLRFELNEAKVQIDQLLKENVFFKSEADKAHQYQSAFQSNQRAISEKISDVSAEAKQKDQTIEQQRDRLSKLELENCQLKDEISALKGRG